MSEVLETAKVKGLDRQASEWSDGDAAAAQVEAQRDDAPSSDDDDDDDADDDDHSSPMADMMRRMFGMEEEKNIPVAEQIPLLREIADRFINRPKFAVGDLVTPHKHAATKGTGAPHIVVEILDAPIDTAFLGDASIGSNNMGMKLDMRVVTFVGEQVPAHLVESANFVRWTPPSEDTDQDAKS